MEIPNLNTKVENESEEKNRIMQNLVQEMNNEFGKIQDLVIINITLTDRKRVS